MDSQEIIFHECLAARKQCVLFDHPNRGMIEVRGKDRVQFLHNVLSNDIKSLSPGKGIAACLLNAQAELIAIMNVLCFKEFLWLALDYSLKNRLFQALQKLIVMEQVDLKDKSDETKLISIHGPKANGLLQNILNSKSVPQAMLSHVSVTIEGVPSTLVRINMTGDTGFGFLAPKEHGLVLRKIIQQKGSAFGLTEIQAQTLETLRIERGILRYGIDYDESHIPLEAGLNHTVSFTKGCFPGQEILARLDSRGGVAKKLIGLELKGESIPKKGDSIIKDSNAVGHITSAAFSPILKRTVAIGYLPKECWIPGSPVIVETGGVQIPARVATLPFYSPSI
ncbi:MAG: aminomethyl transferase family protein [Candidatus Omnitrophica bacterium]|nr:aminomethyl transferase family protein [Candidatus Omnitrophota bacterium]